MCVLGRSLRSASTQWRIVSRRPPWPRCDSRESLSNATRSLAPSRARCTKKNETMNGFSTGSGEEDSRDSKAGNHDQLCCLIDDGERCTRPAGNASYSKRIQKTVQQRKLRLHMDSSVSRTQGWLDLEKLIWHLTSFLFAGQAHLHLRLSQGSDPISEGTPA